jgi:hypothetical protein
MPDVRTAEVGALRHALATAEAEIRAAEARGVRRGFVMAMAELVHTWDATEYAADVLEGAGISWSDILALRLEDRDLAAMKRVRLSRRGALD